MPAYRHVTGYYSERCAIVSALLLGTTVSALTPGYLEVNSSRSGAS